MELENQYEILMNEIIKQEELIENYAEKLEEEGNIDPSIEEYLQNMREDLHQKKEKLKQEFQSKNIQLKEIECNNSDPPSPADSPRAKFKANTPKTNKIPTEKFPFYSVLQIEVTKSPPKPTKIFKKIDQPLRNSSSNSRYSNSSASPERSQPFTLKTVENSQNTELKWLENIELDNLSNDSLETINQKLEEYNIELNNIKFGQEFGKNFNKKYENFLRAKEKLLAEKEKRLNSLMKAMENGNINSKRGEYINKIQDFSEKSEISPKKTTPKIRKPNDHSSKSGKQIDFVKTI